MIALFGKTDNNIMTVQTTHYKPEILTQEELNNSIIVNDIIPKPTQVAGKGYYLTINVTTMEQTWVEVDVPKTANQLNEERLSALEVAMAQMLGM